MSLLLDGIIGIDRTSSNPNTVSQRIEMKKSESLVLRLLELCEPERARDMVMTGLRLGAYLIPFKTVESTRLKVSLAGLELKNPLGLAAGFDKDAKLLSVLPRMGFGFLEVGAVTPNPQTGNAKPRLFRLGEDQAVINRFGFNSQGAKSVAKRLKARRDENIIGLNVGANRQSDDQMADYISVIQSCGEYVDFVTVNISSPNTPGLRDLQKNQEFKTLMLLTKLARDELRHRPKLFVKLAPDLAIEQLREAAEVAVESGFDAIIATNTMAVNFGHGFHPSLNCQLKSKHRGERGGLSGRPLFDLSTRALGEIYRVTKGKIPLIGVGGIETGEDAFQKIQAGATALQIYTSLVFRGFSQTSTILSELDKRLEQEGFDSVMEAVGSDNARWRLKR